jgi:hypothetical protein
VDTHTIGKSIDQVCEPTHVIVGESLQVVEGKDDVAPAIECGDFVGQFSEYFNYIRVCGGSDARR